MTRFHYNDNELGENIQSKNKEIDVVDQDGGKSGGDRGDIGAEDKVGEVRRSNIFTIRS